MTRLWYRDPDALKTEFVTEAAPDMITTRVDEFTSELPQVLAELGRVLQRELGTVRDFHLVRLRVGIEICH